MKHSSKAVLSVCLLCCIGGVFAAPSLLSHPARLPVEGKDSDGVMVMSDQPGGYFHWTAEAWTGGDAPFLAIRKSIDAQVSKGAKPLALLASYRKAARKQPLNPRAQFGWAYSAYVARRRWQVGQDANAIVKGVSDALEQVPSPKAAQYTRMRLFFTLWENRWDNSPPTYFEKCLFRLAKRDPQDYYLKYLFAYKLGGEPRTADTAMDWAKQYHNKFPKDPKAYFLLARLHESRFGIYVSEREGRQAISYYNQYLTSAPSNDPPRQAAKWHISEIGRRTKLFRSKGFLKE